MWWQFDLPTPPPETAVQAVQLSVEADWRQEKEKEVIFIKGQTNLDPGTYLAVKIKGGLKMPSNSDKIELLDLTEVIVDNDGAWMLRSDSLKTNFAPEYYEIFVAIIPDQSRNQNFTEEELDRTRGYYLLNIFSPQLIERRQESITQLMGLANQAYQLDSQLRENLTKIEDVKKGKTPISTLMDGAVGITKTKEALLSELGEKWLTWEKLWLEQLGKLIARVKEEKVCLLSAKTIYNFLYKTRGDYQYYRRQAFVDENSLSQTPINLGTSIQINLEEIKQKHYAIIETELAYKIIHNNIICLEQLVHTFEKTKDQPQMKSLFIGIKQATVDYLVSVKAELTGYAKQELFLENNKPKDNYNQILTLIELIIALGDKYSLRFIEPNDTKLKNSCQELIDLSNQKIQALLSDIR